MSECKIQKVSGKYNTFFTKRFDRENGERIHFASAMTMTGKNEDINKVQQASYLELAEFIQTYGSNIEKNLEQLWRRIIFNIAISNTDDHLRNHGFIIKNDGWELSPAYDLNPSMDKDGLALNIDMENNALDYDLAKSVGLYFRLDDNQMDVILNEVLTVIATWKVIAAEIGIPNREMERMQPAFNL